MARWPNGGPQKLYVIIRHDDAMIFTFATKRERSRWRVDSRVPRDSKYFTFLTYTQDAKK